MQGIGIDLAATLLRRGLTFWLPMLPGVWLARVELRANRSGPVTPHGPSCR
jgi:hypothetical protein